MKFDAFVNFYVRKRKVKQKRNLRKLSGCSTKIKMVTYHPVRYN